MLIQRKRQDGNHSNKPMNTQAAICPGPAWALQGHDPPATQTALSFRLSPLRGFSSQQLPFSTIPRPGCLQQLRGRAREPLSAAHSPNWSQTRLLGSICALSVFSSFQGNHSHPEDSPSLDLLSCPCTTGPLCSAGSSDFLRFLQAFLWPRTSFWTILQGWRLVRSDEWSALPPIIKAVLGNALTRV